MFLLFFIFVQEMFLGFLLLCLTRVSSCSYVSPGAMEKSKLRSSGEQENVFVFFGRAWRQVCLKKKRKGDGLALERWQSV